MEELTGYWQVLFVWSTILILFLLLDIAALKWGIYTSGDRGEQAAPDTLK